VPKKLPTAEAPSPSSINVGRYTNIENGRNTSIYLAPTGLKMGAAGKVQNPTPVLQSLSKGDARRLRKTLRKAGRPEYAAAVRYLK